jgi:hypothetical protein
MLNPWIFTLEAVQRGWQAQSALAFRLMRSFARGVPEQATSSPLIPDTVAVDIKAQAVGQKAPAAIADVRSRKAPKVSRVSKQTSRLKARTVSKRAAAASQNSARKAVRRSARKPR